MKLTNIRIEYKEDLAFLLAELQDNQGTHTLYVAVKKENHYLLDDESADCFLLPALFANFSQGGVLEVDFPISERLLYQLQTNFIPAIVQMRPDFKPISIQPTQSTSTFSYHPEKVVTGISCGVDSSYTIIKHQNVPNSAKLTDLILIEQCADCYITLQSTIPKNNLRRMDVGKKLGLESIYIWTNFIHYFDYPFEQICTFHDVATVLALKKGIKTYYYASSYTLDSFALDFSVAPYYDLFISSCIATDEFQMISHSGLVNRVEKTAAIMDNPIVQKNLDVCFHHNARTDIELINCSKCEKCIRTMVTLDVLGTLDQFSTIFDLDIYKQNRLFYLGQILYRAHINQSVYDKEILEQAKKTGFMIPPRAHLYSLFYGADLQRKKVTRNLQITSVRGE